MSRRRKQWVRRIKAFLKDLRGPWAYRFGSYSQEGEDAVLARLFGKQRRGYYVDVGSHHPQRFSNTYAFYRRGWRGLCIDPLPGVRRRFAIWRPRDLVLELGIAEQPGELVYHQFNEPALNTFSVDLAAQRDGANNWHLIARRHVPTLPLAEVLRRHLPADVAAIDLMSVDVEGLDLQVLRSNDWQRWRPRIVVAECLDNVISRWNDDPVIAFMRAQNYFPIAKTLHSVIFLRDRERFEEGTP